MWAVMKEYWMPDSVIRMVQFSGKAVPFKLVQEGMWKQSSRNGKILNPNDKAWVTIVSTRWLFLATLFPLQQKVMMILNELCVELIWGTNRDVTKRCPKAKWMAAWMWLILVSLKILFIKCVGKHFGLGTMRPFGPNWKERSAWCPLLYTPF